MLKQQQSSSLHKPDFFPIPKLTPLLQSYDIPAPVILYSRSDPYPFLNPDPLVDKSLLQCNDIPEPVSHHSRSDLCQVLDSNLHVDQGLDPVSDMDIDLWIASRSEIEVVARITDLTAVEHAGETLGEPTTIVSTTSSDSSRNSKVGAPQTVKDVVVTKVERENTHSIRCDVCNVICNSQKAFQRHMEGKTHLKNTQKLPVTSPINQKTPSPVVNKILDQDFDKNNEISVDSLFYCSIPELGCANQEFQNIVTEQVIEPICLDGFKPSNGGTHNGHEKLYVHQPMWCDVCKVGCSSNKCFKRHISGKQHLKNVKVSEKKAAAILPSTVIKGEVVNLFESNSTRCELCGISCTSHDGLKSHISGKKHQKNLKKSENLFGNRPANEAKQTLQDPMIEKGEIVEESNKRKADISLSSDTKRQKMMEEEVGGSGVLLTCKVCNVGCTGINAYNFHLASFEHSAMVLKQVKCG